MVGLPKGKVESGEKVEDAAVREVVEECAVRGISLGGLLELTYHTYSYKSEAILKKTYWYAMTCSSKQVLKPQLEEGITEVVWADKTKLSCVSNTYASIVELLKRKGCALPLFLIISLTMVEEIAAHSG